MARVLFLKAEVRGPSTAVTTQSFQNNTFLQTKVTTPSTNSRLLLIEVVTVLLLEELTSRTTRSHIKRFGPK